MIESGPATIDLHTHTTASDGLYSPVVLVQRALEAGLTTIAVVDHDTTDGLDAALARGAELGVRVIPGTEINTEMPGGVEVHILGYYIEYHRPEFQAVLEQLRTLRIRRAERIVERLNAAGITISWERVRSIAAGTVGRPHIAQALIEGHYAEHVSEAFETYLVPGRPGYVPRYKLAPVEAIGLIRSARGVPVLAHPAAIPDLEVSVLPYLELGGLQGIECYYGDYDEVTVTRLIRYANRYGLVPTGGSDYHGPDMHPTPLGGRYVPPTALERLDRTGTFNHKLSALPFTLKIPDEM